MKDLNDKKRKVLIKKNNKLFKYSLFLVVVVLIVAVFKFNELGVKSNFAEVNLQAINKEKILASNNNSEIEIKNIKYNISQFKNGKAQYFVYDDNGVEIKYFILKSSDGVIRTAFDACDVCFRAGRGYQQEGDKMICRNCGRSFASISINEVKGGCNPAPLERKVNGKELIIKIDNIKKGKRYFDI